MSLASLILAVVDAGVCLRLGASYWLLSAHGDDLELGPLLAALDILAERRRPAPRWSGG